MDLEGLLPCTQNFAPDLCPEPRYSNSHPISFSFILILPFHLRPGVPSDIASGFPIRCLHLSFLMRFKLGSDVHRKDDTRGTCNITGSALWNCMRSYLSYDFTEMNNILYPLSGLLAILLEKMRRCF